MKKLLPLLSILYPFLLLTLIICLISCMDKENNYIIFKAESTKAESPINFNLIDCLNESNKKNIDLSNLAFDQTKDVKTLQLLLKIKKEHQKIDSELKKLTENNMIIIPKMVYELNIDSDSLKVGSSSLYLLKMLENEIQNQIAIFGQINETSKNVDFKSFALKNKTKLQTNDNELKNILNI